MCANARTHSDYSGDQESFIQSVLKHISSLAENISVSLSSYLLSHLTIRSFHISRLIVFSQCTQTTTPKMFTVQFNKCRKQQCSITVIFLFCKSGSEVKGGISQAVTVWLASVMHKRTPTHMWVGRRQESTVQGDSRGAAR